MPDGFDNTWGVLGECGESLASVFTLPHQF